MSNTNFTEADFIALQQQLNNLQQIVQHQQQQQEAQVANMQGIDSQPTPLHSFGIRPNYTWIPSDPLNEALELETPLFNSDVLPDEERRQVIESYPAIQNLQYQPPAALPMASQRMNKGQQKEDATLKRIQYLLSAVFRPLDILGHELSIASDMSQVDRYLQILGDARRLLLHTSSSITSSRNNIAF